MRRSLVGKEIGGGGGETLHPRRKTPFGHAQEGARGASPSRRRGVVALQAPHFLFFGSNPQVARSESIETAREQKKEPCGERAAADDGPPLTPQHHWAPVMYIWTYMNTVLAYVPHHGLVFSFVRGLT